MLPNARLQQINALSLTEDSVHTPDNIRTNTLLLLTAEDRYLSEVTNTHKKNVKIDKSVSSSVHQPTHIIKNVSFNSVLVNTQDQSYQCRLTLQEHTTNTSKNVSKTLSALLNENYSLSLSLSLSLSVCVIYSSYIGTNTATH